jgi:tight adherence protein B
VSGSRGTPTGGDLAAVVAEVAAALRAGAGPAEAWARVLGAPPAPDGSPSEAEILAALRRRCAPPRRRRGLPGVLRRAPAPRHSPSRTADPEQAQRAPRPWDARLVALVRRERVVDPGLLRSIALVVAATRLAHVLGAPLAVVLDRCATSLEAEHETASDVEAALAGPQQTAGLLGWLPAVGLLLGAVLGADPIAVLLDGGWGTAAAVGGGLLTLVGRRWVRRLVRTARSAGGL